MDLFGSSPVLLVIQVSGPSPRLASPPIQQGLSKWVRLVGLPREPDRREWSLLLQAGGCGGADNQPRFGAGLRQALDALFLAWIGRDHQQAWQRAQFSGPFARAGIVRIRMQLHRQRRARHLSLVPFHPEAQTPGIRHVFQGSISCC